MKLVKKLIMKLLFGKRASSESFVKFLKRRGVKIDDGTVFFYPRDVFVDVTRPWLVQIGKNVQITKNVTILTHGYDWSVLKGKYGEILGSSGKVKIGDNVFIGFNTTILKGVCIGNNVIIGANSLVNHDVPDNCVVAGNPAKVIMTLEEYYEKRQKKQDIEARELVREYCNCYNKIPNEETLREFYFLFKKREEETFEDNNFIKIMKLVNNFDMAKEKFMNTKNKYEGFEDFINKCDIDL